MSKVLLFNPRSANNKPRIPNSILSIAASIDGVYDYAIVDGNMEVDPSEKIKKYLDAGDFKYFGCTSMPGPQLKQAIPITKYIRKNHPEIKIIWGGYFPSNQSRSVLNSGYVDFIINGPGDKCFPSLLKALDNNEPYELISNLIYRSGDQIIKTKKDELYDQDELPALPYERLNSFYPVERYLGKTYLGTKTIAYHSSMGCPFKCSFCAVVPIYNARWRGKSAQTIYNDIKYLKDNFGGNAIEFHDNNFFVSEKRVVEFSKLIEPDNMIWWGEGRIDTIDKYSFGLGTPGDTPEQTMKQIDADIAFIKKVKEINPRTEIVIYVYSPVPTEGSDMYNKVLESGFKFPERLEDWISPAWENFDLRKNPLTPWLTPEMVNKIKDFEAVLNSYYPTVSDIRLNSAKRKILRSLSTLRYKTNFYWKPYELKALQILWKYRQPEIEGF